MTLAEQFGRKLFMARRRLGVTQEDLARFSGLHRTEVQKLEGGRREPRLGTVVTGARPRHRPGRVGEGAASMTGAAPPAATLKAMAKQSKKPADLNRLAAAIVGDATDEDRVDRDEGKDPAAVALGRKGGEKGGKVRASRMTAEERSEAARKAAKFRWRKAP